MGKKLVLVGGGHAHMVTLANLHAFVDKGHDVTVIQPSEHHYYSGMGPGMLGKVYAPEDIRDFCRGQISHYKIPKYVAFVKDYPMTASGKIQKFKLREMAETLFPDRI